MQEALRRYKEEVAADPDTSSGFFTNTNAANDTKQYVLVRDQLARFCVRRRMHSQGERPLPRPPGLEGEQFRQMLAGLRNSSLYPWHR